jgi:hypothetical protein
MPGMPFAGWEFPRLVDLRGEWVQRQGGWEWPNDLSEWAFNPNRQDNSGWPPL